MEKWFPISESKNCQKIDKISMNGFCKAIVNEKDLHVSALSTSIQQIASMLTVVMIFQVEQCV